MPKNIALVVGISEYKFLPRLLYAQKDAELIGKFLEESAEFHPRKGGDVCLCTHDSPQFHGYSTHPTRAELRRILRRCFNETFLGPEDSFWFFFSGHGVRHKDKDYLMPADGDPEEPDETAIELNYVTERLERSGADQMVIILDACRSEGEKNSQINFGQDMPKGITTIFSCHPKESSYEIGDPICQSTLTYVLLQSLHEQTPENALTISKFEEYLQIEVPKLNQQYNKPQQRPHIRCDFAANGNKILLPHLRVPLTIAQLKESAFRAEALGDLAQAKQLWLTVLRRAATHTIDHQDAEVGLERVIHTSRLGDNTADSKQTTTSTQPQRLAVSLPAPEDDTISEKGIDYTRLRDLLKAGKWRDADLETYNLMLLAIGEKSRHLPNEFINFPCKDLLTIDRLWCDLSGGRFGFSVQKKIWQDCGSPQESRYYPVPFYLNNWETFCIKLGWVKRAPSDLYMSVKYLYYDQLKADLRFSPAGEFPCRSSLVSVIERKKRDELFPALGRVSIFSRLESCLRSR